MTSIWVYTCENHGSSLEVPITPDTCVRDVLNCVRDPVRGHGDLVAVANDTEYVLREDENIWEFLHAVWYQSGTSLSFSLRYKEHPAGWPPPGLRDRRQHPLDSSADESSCESPFFAISQLPGGTGDLTLAELQEMSSRQQQQMEAQQQVLVAKEQRLKYLKQQEARHAQLASETEQLKRIRERVENQELKLKKLRALRGQAEQYRISNGQLTGELEAVKAVFNEKEKELAMAVARVDQLTRQLQELRGQGVSGGQSAATAELNKLRKELLIRNKLNEQQSNTIATKEKLLSQRKEEVSRMDIRIHELQQRLKKRRNQEQQANQNQAKKPAPASAVPPANVATVEPYIQYAPQNVVKDDSYKRTPGHFVKQDPKYQTLPSNVKFVPPEGRQGGKRLEMNNNNEYIEEYTLPTVLPVDSRKGPANQTNRIDNRTDSVIPQPRQLGPPSQPAKPMEATVSQPVKPVARPRSDRQAAEVRGQPAPLQPVISILEEERQAGSGQSSPASSEGSDSSGGLRVVKGDGEINTSSLGPVSAMIEKLNSGQPGQPQTSKPAQTTAQSTAKPSQPTPTPASKATGQVPPSPLSPHLNQKPAPTYRYASKNQIANTYLGRLGGAAMDKYQKNLNALYRNQDFNAVVGRGDAVSGEQGEAAAHNYPDIASDKGSYKLNTPKQVRRRHSDSENEEMNKALQLQERKETMKTEEETAKKSDKPNVAATVETKEGNVKSDSKMNTLATKEISTNQVANASNSKTDNASKPAESGKPEVVKRRTKSNLKKEGVRRSTNRVSFDPLALLLDASLEGELELVKKVAVQVDDVSTANDEGITALHNAICAGHYEIVKFLVQFGCDVNSPDSDGWTPLHCAASCNNLPMVRFLVEHGACVFATTISDQETAADKCEEDEDGYEGCSDYLYSIQEKLGIANSGEVYSVFDYQATNTDELSFQTGEKLSVLRKGDEKEKEWWWAQLRGKDGYIPRNLLGLHPRVIQQPREVSEC